MAIIPWMFKNAVVPIGVRHQNDITWVGTGFLVVRRVSQDGVVPFLVTNRHVLEGQLSIVFSLKKIGTNDLKYIDVKCVNATNIPLYRFHANPDIDIAVLCLNAEALIKFNVEFPAFDIDKDAMTSAELREKGCDDGTLVYMLGFTLGFVNAGSKEPLCRLGCVARMSEEQVNQQKNILVDIQNFPGNSGSPLITRPEFFSVDRSIALDRCVLLGVVHSYLPYQDQLVSAQTHQVVEVRSENSGIAKVHPVEYIRDIIDSFVAVEQ